MPVHKSAEKKMRRDSRARTRNRMWKSKIKTAKKTLERAISNNETDKIQELFKEYVSMMDKAASRRVIHPNNASRKKRALSRKVKSVLSGE